MRGFLLDSHVTPDLIPGLKAAVPDCEVVHLATWERGVYLHKSDELILTRAWQDDLVLVSFDVHTVPETVRRLMLGGQPIAGAALFPTRFRRTVDVGGLVRALTELYFDPSVLEPGYPVVYLQPLPDRTRRGEKGR